jgi:hypothetical protein
MITNRAILGFFVVLIAIILGIILIRRNPNFLARFRGTTPTPTPTVGLVIPTAGTSTGSVTTTQSGAGQPLGLTACSSQTMNNCTIDTPVCGWERVEAGGTTAQRSLTYRSACAYCKLYNSSGVLNLGEENYYALGYSTGACTATK